MLRRLTYYARRFSEIVPENLLGIRTAEWHDQFDESRPNFRGHMPTSYRDWRLIRPMLEAIRGCIFVDYGAGLGRVVALAARLPFTEVIGVEIDPDLARRGNVN